jgi:hypothetical protein
MDWVHWSMVDRAKGVMPRFNLRRPLRIGQLASSTRDGAAAGTPEGGGARRSLAVNSPATTEKACPTMICNAERCYARLRT